MNRYLFVFLLILLTAFASCANPEKHLDNAEELERSGRRLDANREYIRALSRTTDKNKQAELQRNIANNYYRADRINDAIDYYKKAIATSLEIKIKPPYRELAKCYVSKNDTSAAIALISEIERSQPVDGILIKGDIQKLLGAYYAQRDNITEAVYFYEQYLKSAEESGNEQLIQDAKLRLELAQQQQ